MVRLNLRVNQPYHLIVYYIFLSRTPGGTRRQDLRLDGGPVNEECDEKINFNWEEQSDGTSCVHHIASARQFPAPGHYNELSQKHSALRVYTFTKDLAR